MTDPQTGSPVVPGRATVIIPSYNHARYVADAIGSVQAQTYPDVELVVIDDASTDDSVAVIERLRQKHPFALLINDTNQGLNTSLRRAFTAATGEYVSVLASDDMVLPDKIARQVDALTRENKDVVYATGHVLHADGREELVVLDHVARELADGALLEHAYTDDTGLPLLQSALFRRTAYAALEPLRDRYRLDDWIILIAALERFRVGFLNEPLFVYRQHDSNTHQDYERTLGMRMEVALNAVPQHLRRRSMARIFTSSGKYRAWDSRYGAALHHALVSQVIRPDLRNLVDFGRALAVQLRRDLRRLFTSAAR